MNTMAVIPVEELPKKLSEIENKVYECKNVFEQVQVRDELRTYIAASEIYRRKDLAIKFNALIHECQYFIGKMNPAIDPKESGAMKTKVLHQCNTLPTYTLSRIRKTYENVTIDEVRELCKRNEDRNEVTTMSDVRKFSASKKPHFENVVVVPPSGLYSTIVIDPPWDLQKSYAYENSGFTAHLPYPVMSDEEVGSLELPKHEDCHIFMWTVQQKIRVSYSIMEKWGAVPRQLLCWIKNGGPKLPSLMTSDVEFILYGRVGSPSFLTTKAFGSHFYAKRGSHSEKPEAFYDLLRRVTDEPRIDMFARRKIEGFDNWGNEV